jgi:hypothetical protein
LQPNAYIEPGFPKDVMPQNFASVLSKQQLDALVPFLKQGAKGS